MLVGLSLTNRGGGGGGAVILLIQFKKNQLNVTMLSSDMLTLTRPMHRRTNANLYPLEKQLTKASEPSFNLEGGAKGQI